MLGVVHPHSREAAGVTFDHCVETRSQTLRPEPFKDRLQVLAAYPCPRPQLPQAETMPGSGESVKDQHFFAGKYEGEFGSVVQQEIAFRANPRFDMRQTAWFGLELLVGFLNSVHGTPSSIIGSDRSDDL
jgi:hypothetical protein